MICVFFKCHRNNLLHSGKCVSSIYRCYSTDDLIYCHIETFRNSNKEFTQEDTEREKSRSSRLSAWRLKNNFLLSLVLLSKVLQHISVTNPHLSHREFTLKSSIYRLRISYELWLHVVLHVPLTSSRFLMFASVSSQFISLSRPLSLLSWTVQSPLVSVIILGAVGNFHWKSCSFLAADGGKSCLCSKY